MSKFSSSFTLRFDLDSPLVAIIIGLVSIFLNYELEGIRMNGTMDL